MLLVTLTLGCGIVLLSLPGQNALPQVASWGQLRDSLTAAAAVVLLGGTWLLGVDSIQLPGYARLRSWRGYSGRTGTS